MTTKNFCKHGRIPDEEWCPECEELDALRAESAARARLATEWQLKNDALRAENQLARTTIDAQGKAVLQLSAENEQLRREIDEELRPRAEAYERVVAALEQERIEKHQERVDFAAENERLRRVVAMALNDTAIPQAFPNWAAHASDALGSAKAG